MITAAHKGNGLSVWIEGDSETVAHISRDRKITWYIEPTELKIEDYKRVLWWAETSDPTISATQDDYVLDVPKFLIGTSHDRGAKILNPDVISYRGYIYRWKPAKTQYLGSVHTWVNTNVKEQDWNGK